MLLNQTNGGSNSLEQFELIYFQLFSLGGGGANNPGIAENMNKKNKS